VKRLFAVIRSRGAAWNDSLPLEEQVDWRPHADELCGWDHVRSAVDAAVGLARGEGVGSGGAKAPRRL